MIFQIFTIFIGRDLKIRHFITTMRKKQIRLSEARLHQIIKENIRKALNEGMTSDNPAYNKWEQIKEILGADTMVDSIFQYLDSSTLEQLVEWFGQEYDLFDDYDEEDDY